MQFDQTLLDHASMHAWELYSRAIGTEYRQCVDEGKDVMQYEALARAIDALPLGPVREELADIFFKAMLAAQQRPDYPYDEPSELSAIRAARPAARPQLPRVPDGATLRARVAGAWLGRVCGCLLGKPVEGWPSQDIEELARKQGNFPLTKYLAFDEEICRRLGRMDGAWIDRIDGCAPVDDDTNYTALAALCVIEKYGRGFTPRDVAEAWVASQPKNAYCTAERRAFRNFVIGIQPPASATYKNPDREFIGAQIRADYFGYICPGDPEQAADMAWRDGCISHVKNGIYGEMFVAAMLAAAAVTDDMLLVIEAGLGEIPISSRLYEAVRSLLADHAAGLSQAECFAALHRRYDEGLSYDWVHTIPNALIVVASLLYGEKDYGRSVCMAVQQGFDTDCNGATVGSIVGMMLGEAGIPEMWSRPMGGRLKTSIFGASEVSVADMAALTMKHIALGSEQDL